MTTYTFNGDFKTVGTVNGVAPISQLEKEVGVYSATPAFVREHCGPIANSILDTVPTWYAEEAVRLCLHLNIDVRIHRLYPGDYPAYPGWHCDGEYRETYFSQPDLHKVKVHNHLICTVSSHEAGVSNPEFITDNVSVDVTATEGGDAALWAQVSRAMVGAEIATEETADGDLVCFNSWTLHRVRPAKIRGWRLFFRASMWHRPNLGTGGMLTKQEQIYKITEQSGW